MGFNNLSAGKNVPDDINVVIEIPMHGEPVKYEIDKESDAIFVDRFMSTSMHYPCNYGYTPRTLGEDGDPVDVLVIAPIPLIPGVVIRARPIGILDMEDEAGGDQKILSVPISKVTAIYDDISNFRDLPALTYKRIEHFFETYKDLEEGKFVKTRGWKDAEAARQEILMGVQRYNESCR